MHFMIRLDNFIMSREDWQGFEHFHDISETHPLLDIAVPPLTISQPPPRRHSTKPYKRIPTTTKNIFSDVSPKKESTVPVFRQKKQAYEKEEEETYQYEKQEEDCEKEKIRKDERDIDEQKKQGEKHWREEVRFTRIPILRFQEELSRAGRVVYRGFLGRTSDYVLRNMREVEWEGAKKREVRNLHGIEFSSQFQGGNLGLAVEVAPLDYDLYLRVDSNTQGHRQWFYFSMRNTHTCTVKIRLLRFKKCYSLFQRGMRPYARSRSQPNWHPAGQDIVYRPQNSVKNGQSPKNFTLCLSYTFEQAQDEVFFAAGVPYTYSYLQRQLIFFKTMSSQKEHLVWEIDSLGRSTSGLDIPLLSVYHRLARLLPSTPSYIVINCRSHPGEASSSWVLEGFLRQLVESAEVEQWLLSMNIQFRIIPMLNPDGVVLGNYRTSILGEDLNRQFGGRLRGQTRVLGKMVKGLTEVGKVLLFLDLHGHSVLKNSFLYGPNESQWSRSRMKWLPQHLFHRSKYFRLASCRYRNPPADTARAHFQQNHITSLTCENSLGLYHAHQQTFQMLPSDWNSFGQNLLHALKDTLQIHHIEAELPKITHLKAKISQHRTINKTKNEKVHLKMELEEPLWSSSKGISRQDELLELGTRKETPKKDHFSPDKISKIKQFRSRRPSQAARTPASGSPTKKFISRQSSEQIGGQQLQFPFFERSITCDQSTLQLEIQSKNNETKEENGYCTFNEDAEREDFSDEYQSINDSDPSSDDLPEQDRQYLLECVGESKSEEQNRNRSLSREPIIGRFRQMRFNSMQGDQEEGVRPPVGKPKLQPHKFKVVTCKSLLGQRECEVSFWQKKQLNQRAGPLRRTQKEPFLLLQRKEKSKQ